MSNDSSKTPVTKSTTAAFMRARQRAQARIVRKMNASEVAPWGPLRAVMGVIFSFIGVQVITTIIVAVYANLQGWSSETTVEWLSETVPQFTLLAVSEILTLCIIWMFIMQYPWQRVKAALGLHKIRWHDAGWVILGAVLYFAAYLTFLSVIRIFLPINVEQEQEIGFDNVQNTAGLALTFIGLVVLAPVTEEIVFRGYLYAGMRRWVGIVGGAIFTSIIFSLPHLVQGADGNLLWVAGIDTFALSLVLCYLREKTGSIYAGMGVHAVKNCIAFLALYVFIS